MKDHEDGEYNLVEKWLTKDPARWAAGVCAGITAGIASMAFAMILAKAGGQELLAPVKFAAIPLMGAAALDYGMGSAAIAGFVVHMVLCTFLGLVYAHFTITNNMTALVGVGFTWGAFSWIFLNNLFFPAWREVFVSQFSSGAAFFVCMVFGFSLVSVSLFDRMLRRS